VLEPGSHFGPPLVAQGAGHPGERFVVGHEHPALAGRDLLVGVEAECRRVTESAHPGPAILGAEGLARVVDDRQVVPRGEIEDTAPVGGMPEDIDDKHGTGPGSPLPLEIVRRDVVGIGFDIHEHRRGPFVQNRVDGRGESERGNEYLVTRTDSQSLNGEV